MPLSARVSGLFAVHFFGFGLFLPFFPVVLGFRGLSAAEIGLILGAGTIARLAASPALSNLSDRTGQRRLSILIYSLISAAFLVLFFAPGGLVVLGLAVIGFMVMNSPITPLSDAYALDVQRNTGADYARMRLWGSAGFVLATLAGGALAAIASRLADTEPTVVAALILLCFIPFADSVAARVIRHEFLLSRMFKPLTVAGLSLLPVLLSAAIFLVLTQVPTE